MVSISFYIVFYETNEPILRDGYDDNFETRVADLKTRKLLKETTRTIQVDNITDKVLDKLGYNHDILQAMMQFKEDVVSKLRNKTQYSYLEGKINII